MKYSFCILLCWILIGSQALGASAVRQDDLIIKNTLKVGGASAPNSKSALEVESTTKGFLPPRMTTTQRNAITSPPAGLSVFNTTTNKATHFDGASWREGSTIDGTETLSNKSLSAPQILDFADLTEQADVASNPGSGKRRMYVKTDGKAYLRNSSGAETALGSGTGPSGPSKNFVVNPSAASDTTTWGGVNVSFDRDVTVGNKINGVASFALTSATHTAMFISDAMTLDDDTTGNCEAQILYKGDASKWKFALWNAAELQSVALTNETGWRMASFNYPCTTGLTLRVISTAASPANINVGGFYWGKATNIGSVAQAEYIGSIKFSGSGNACVWSAGISTSFANFTQDAACDTTVDGNAAVLGSKRPGMTMTNLKPGRYVAYFTGFFGSTATGKQAYLRLFDGTTQWGGVISAMSSAGTNYAPSTAVWETTYNAPQASVSIDIQGMIDSGGGIQLGGGAVDDVLSVYRFPTTAEQAVSVDTTAQSWSGYHDNTCSWARTNTALGDPAADATCAFAQRTNTNFGTVASAISGSDKLPGITFSPTQVGKYDVKVVFLAQGPGNTNTAFQLTDGTTVVAQTQYFFDTANQLKSITLSGQYVASPTAPVTLKLQTSATANTVTIGGGSNTTAIAEWSIVAINQGFPAPLLVGGVVNSSSGVSRPEAMTLTPNGAAGSCTYTQHGDWISSVSGSAVGDCTVTIKAGVFSAAPKCIVTSNNSFTTPDRFHFSTSVFSKTSTSFRIQSSVLDDTSGTVSGDGSPVDILCFGPR
ncbi:MAG: hypothetical protein A2428_03165 [Bdellovibrionales bacterium RIFOXYC1_FULL_54_43]|nr:MAG: hypothetical protein A2428_03165 [Bdellovibrionales bacterium RIFOXYC1_FULL_54_43]OFZ82681.1 MAG: hypothetical protein A2603_02600 [Bdellovibrionales bacterium RIFOXYD1_FULL_55_31]